MKKSIAVVFYAALGASMVLGVQYLYQTKNNLTLNNPNQVKSYAVNNVGNALAPSVDFVDAAASSLNAVVHIKTSTEIKQQVYDPFRYFFGGQPQTQTQIQQGSGSGVIISNDGYIVTNNHVIANAQDIEVVLNNKKSYKGELVGTDPSTDLAVVKIKENELPFIVYGNSDEVKVGQWVLAVGNPFNLTSTVTAGIVSAKGRDINIINASDNSGRRNTAIESFIQTDAAVNPGNSGGALVDVKGQLVGINSAIASNTGSFTGYSFAIPVNIVRKVVADLVEFGLVKRAYLGAQINEIDSKFAKEKNLTVLEGVYVHGFNEGSATQKAGVKAGDVITHVGNNSIKNSADLLGQIGQYRPGDKIDLTVIRDGKEKVIPVTLLDSEGGELAGKEIKKVNNANVYGKLGASFQDLDATEMKKFGLTGGSKIVAIQSGKLASAGVREGYIVTAIDHKKINNTKELMEILNAKSGGVLIELISPNGARVYTAFGI